MPYLPSLPQDATLLHVFKKFPASSKVLIEYHEVLMRGSSPLSVAERELIAAFVSRLNACQYCSGVHTATAGAFGIEEGLLERLVEDVDAAGVGQQLRPILHYVRKLTLAPSRMAQADADEVFAAGWDEQALHDAVSVCALFNFMNRLAEGTGILGTRAYFEVAAARLHGRGYLPLIEMMKTP